ADVDQLEKMTAEQRRQAPPGQAPAPEQQKSLLEVWRRLARKVGSPDPFATLEASQKAVQDWFHQQALALSLPDSRVAELVAKLQQVRTQGLEILEVRACAMGDNRPLLHLFRQLFRADVFGAPVVLSAFGEVIPAGHIGSLVYRNFLKG